jgi:hypothetical protein
MLSKFELRCRIHVVFGQTMGLGRQTRSDEDDGDDVTSIIDSINTIMAGGIMAC